jgi:hypothetical protein
MRKTELDPRIVNWLNERLKGKISEKTIRPAISRIARKDSSTLNEAAAKFAKKHREVLPRRFVVSGQKETLDLTGDTNSRESQKRANEKIIIQFAKYDNADKYLRAHLDEINRSYTFNCYTATFILCRKVLENLIVHHILMVKFPNSTLENKQKYFDINKERFLDFSLLISNLRRASNDFGTEKSLVERICDLAAGFKETANDMTHSRYHIARKNELDEKGYQQILDMVADLERSMSNPIV